MILPYICNHLGSQGISFDISAALQKIGVVCYKDALIAVLVDVAGVAIDLTVMEAVGLGNALDDTWETLPFPGTHQDMEMVRHEAIVVYVKLELLLVGRDDIFESPEIQLALEEQFLVMAALDDVIYRVAERRRLCRDICL